METLKRLLILMAKYPAPGKTKTRLMPVLSAEQAAELYACFLQDKVAQMRQVTGATLAIAFTPPHAESYFRSLVPEFTLLVQRGKTLAERLNHVTAQGFKHGYDVVAAIDGDSVTLPPAFLQQALDNLSVPEVDVTLGGCEDGGYYAIAMKKLHPSLFHVRMSTPHVYTDTLKKAQQAGLNVSELPVWYDVDTPDDLRRARQDLKGQNTPSARFLQTLHLPENTGNLYL